MSPSILDSLRSAVGRALMVAKWLLLVPALVLAQPPAAAASYDAGSYDYDAGSDVASGSSVESPGVVVPIDQLGSAIARVAGSPGHIYDFPADFVAPSGALPSADVAVIGKVDDLGLYPLRPGERTLLNQLPNQGSPRLNYLQNDRVLRTEMGRGVPIRDVSVDPVTGALRNNTGFLRAERNILTNHGWMFDPKSGDWYPPG